MKKQLSDVVKRYDVNKYTPPFRVGRKQGKAVLDSKGLEVVFFMHSEEQAKMYCDYLNNVSNNEVALKAFVEEFVEAWGDGMGGDSSLYDAAKRLL